MPMALLPVPLMVPLLLNKPMLPPLLMPMKPLMVPLLLNKPMLPAALKTPLKPLLMVPLLVKVPLLTDATTAVLPETMILPPLLTVKSPVLQEYLVVWLLEDVMVAWACAAVGTIAASAAVKAKLNTVNCPALDGVFCLAYCIYFPAR